MCQNMSEHGGRFCKKIPEQVLIELHFMKALCRNSGKLPRQVSHLRSLPREMPINLLLSPSGTNATSSLQDALVMKVLLLQSHAHREMTHAVSTSPT